MENKSKKRIVVIGGGFAGLQFIKNLKRNEFDILLIDKMNHHMFQPLFYQVAAAQIEPSSISFPFRNLLRRRKDVRIRLGVVKEIDYKNSLINTTIGEIAYDILVIATGCKTNFFGNENIKKYSYSLKSTVQSIKIKNLILENFEKILYTDEKERQSLYNIVIVGAGPTGVELSGAFAEIKKNILPKDFYRIDFSKLQIILVEGSEHTLNNMSQMAQNASEKYLTELGVLIKKGVFVNNYDGSTITLSNGELISSKNLIWTAGVTGNILRGLPLESISKSNRYIVDRHNKVEGCDNIYAIGDVALMKTPKYPEGHPQVANVAINQGKNLAKNILLEIDHKNLKDYEYQDKGSMATIGKNKAVVDLPYFSFKGYIAWYIWMFLHLMLILSVRNKVIIFIDWAWNYISNNSGLRLIIKKNEAEE